MQGFIGKDCADFQGSFKKIDKKLGKQFLFLDFQGILGYYRESRY